MIKELDIQDCKVRVTNVDSQESAETILVQVIGEMSNRAAPHRKFVQTFVLAKQPTGYFVLNDIFRYILDEEEDEEAINDVEGGEVPSVEADSTPATLPDSDDPAEQQHSVEKIDRKLQQDVIEKSAEEVTIAGASTNGAGPAGEAAVVGETDVVPNTASKEGEDSKSLEQATESSLIEEVTQPEKPRDPDPTPIASPPKPAKATPVDAPSAPPKPAAPKTWANLVAKGAVATPVNAAQKSAGPAAPAAPGGRSANASSKEVSTPTTPGAEDFGNKPQANGGTGWQTAGTDKQRQGRQHSQSISSNQENTLAYVKNVNEKVDAAILKATLAEFGKLVYFDVSRQKVKKNPFPILPSKTYLLHPELCLR